MEIADTEAKASMSLSFALFSISLLFSLLCFSCFCFQYFCFRLLSPIEARGSREARSQMSRRFVAARTNGSVFGLFLKPNKNFVGLTLRRTVLSNRFSVFKMVVILLLLSNRNSFLLISYQYHHGFEGCESNGTKSSFPLT